MSSDRIYLSREEQIFLMEMLEIDDPLKAVEKFAFIIVDEKANPDKLEEYLKTIMKRMK
jgi:hypothetical protein